MQFSLLLNMALVTFGFARAAGKKPLYIMHLNIPSMGTWDLNLITEFTLNILNNETDLLPDHELRVINGTAKNFRRQVSAFSIIQVCPVVYCIKHDFLSNLFYIKRRTIVF